MLEIKNFRPAEESSLIRENCLAMWDDGDSIGMC